MARYAVIYGNTVANVIEAEAGFDMPGASLIESATAAPGWVYDNGTLSAPTLSLDAQKAAKQAFVDARRDLLLISGFTVPANVSTTLGGKVLQTRDLDDRTNWLTSQAAYAAQVSAGQGTTIGATFRAADNSTASVSYSEGLNVLLAMAAWGKSIYGNSWSLKDQIAAAADQAALDSIDIAAGWPT